MLCGPARRNPRLLTKRREDGPRCGRGAEPPGQGSQALHTHLRGWHRPGVLGGRVGRRAQWLWAGPAGPQGRGLLWLVLETSLTQSVFVPGSSWLLHTRVSRGWCCLYPEPPWQVAPGTTGPRLMTCSRGRPPPVLPLLWFRLRGSDSSVPEGLRQPLSAGCSLHCGVCCEHRCELVIPQSPTPDVAAS